MQDLAKPAKRGVTSLELSFMSVDDGPSQPNRQNLTAGWTSKFRRRDEKKPADSTSFMDLRDCRPFNSPQPELTENEKALARRRVQKLEQVSGRNSDQSKRRAYGF